MDLGERYCIKNKINYYSVERLYENGIEKDGMLICNNIVSNYALIDTFDRENCHLFDQAKKALKNSVEINELFIIVDFSGFGNIFKFSTFINGIQISINGKDIVFVDYLKSNSMNKKSCLYYVNKQYVELINEEIKYDDEENGELEINNDFINSFQIRLPFLKGVIHSCDFKSFFKEHNITKIKGYYAQGKTRYYDVDNLKLILTKSQFKASSFVKYMKFTIDDYFGLLEKYGYHLGISGVEPKVKNAVKLCYQFLSTLPIKTLK